MSKRVGSITIPYIIETTVKKRKDLNLGNSLQHNMIVRHFYLRKNSQKSCTTIVLRLKKIKRLEENVYVHKGFLYIYLFIYFKILFIRRKFYVNLKLFFLLSATSYRKNFNVECCSLRVFRSEELGHWGASVLTDCESCFLSQKFTSWIMTMSRKRFAILNFFDQTLKHEIKAKLVRS